MIKLLIAMAVTIIGLIVLLTFIKLSEKELEVYADFEKAKKEFLDAVVQSLKIDKFVYWLNKKLDRP